MGAVRGSLLWCALICALPLGARAQDAAAAPPADPAAAQAQAQTPGLEEAQPAPSLGAPEPAPGAVPAPAPGAAEPADAESPGAATPPAPQASPPAARDDAAPADVGARADGRARAGRADDSRAERSYAEPIMVADAAAGGLALGATGLGIACIATAFGSDDDGGSTALCALAVITGIGAVGTYALASPIVHGIHDHPDRAVLAALLRIGLPVGAGVLASELDADDELIAPLVIGGVIAAVLIDWFVLAEESDAPDAGDARLTPWIAPRAAGLGLSGSF